MKKFYLKEEDRNEEEKRTGRASYRSIINRYIDDLVLCNNIAEIDESVLDNINIDLYDEENDEYVEIYQYYLCNLSTWEIEELTAYGIILSYSDKLECEVLCVEHCGTSWDYVPTEVELTEML